MSFSSRRSSHSRHKAPWRSPSTSTLCRSGVVTEVSMVVAQPEIQVQGTSRTGTAVDCAVRASSGARSRAGSVSGGGIRETGTRKGNERAGSCSSGPNLPRKLKKSPSTAYIQDRDALERLDVFVESLNEDRAGVQGEGSPDRRGGRGRSQETLSEGVHLERDADRASIDSGIGFGAPTEPPLQAQGAQHVDGIEPPPHRLHPSAMLLRSATTSPPLTDTDDITGQQHGAEGSSSLSGQPQQQDSPPRSVSPAPSSHPPQQATSQSQQQKHQKHEKGRASSWFASFSRSRGRQYSKDMDLHSTKALSGSGEATTTRSGGEVTGNTIPTTHQAVPSQPPSHPPAVPASVHDPPMISITDTFPVPVEVDGESADDSPSSSLVGACMGASFSEPAILPILHTDKAQHTIAVELATSTLSTPFDSSPPATATASKTPTPTITSTGPSTIPTPTKPSPIKTPTKKRSWFYTSSNSSTPSMARSPLVQVVTAGTDDDDTGQASYKAEESTSALGQQGAGEYNKGGAIGGDAIILVDSTETIRPLYEVASPPSAVPPGPTVLFSSSSAPSSVPVAPSSSRPAISTTATASDLSSVHSLPSSIDDFVPSLPRIPVNGATVGGQKRNIGHVSGGGTVSAGGAGLFSLTTYLGLGRSKQQEKETGRASSIENEGQGGTVDKFDTPRPGPSLTNPDISISAASGLDEDDGRSSRLDGGHPNVNEPVESQGAVSTTSALDRASTSRSTTATTSSSTPSASAAGKSGSDSSTAARTRFEGHPSSSPGSGGNGISRDEDGLRDMATSGGLDRDADVSKLEGKGQEDAGNEAETQGSTSTSALASAPTSRSADASYSSSTSTTAATSTWWDYIGWGASTAGSSASAGGNRDGDVARDGMTNLGDATVNGSVTAVRETTITAITPDVPSRVNEDNEISADNSEPSSAISPASVSPAEPCNTKKPPSNANTNISAKEDGRSLASAAQAGANGRSETQSLGVSSTSATSTSNGGCSGGIATRGINGSAKPSGDAPIGEKESPGGGRGGFEFGNPDGCSDDGTGRVGGGGNTGVLSLPFQSGSGTDVEGGTESGNGAEGGPIAEISSNASRSGGGARKEGDREGRREAKEEGKHEGSGGVVAWYSPWAWYSAGTDSATSTQDTTSTTASTANPTTESDPTSPKAKPGQQQDGDSATNTDPASANMDPSIHSEDENGSIALSQRTPIQLTVKSDDAVGVQAPKEDGGNHNVGIKNPIEASIQANRSGWASFFSSRALVIGYGSAETETVTRDENGLEVMEIDEDDESNANPHQKQSTGVSRALVKANPVIGGSNLPKPSTEGPPVSDKPAPPLTEDEDLKDKVTNSLPIMKSDPSGGRSPTVPATPSKPKDSPSPNNKPLSAPTTPNRTASPTPSKKGLGPPPPPNLVLPTWEDIFHTAPRNILPPRLSTSSRSSSSSDDADAASGNGTTIFGKTMKFVSGVLFPNDQQHTRPSGAARRHGSSARPRSSSLGRSSSGLDIQKLLEEARRKRFERFGEEFPKAWKVVHGNRRSEEGGGSSAPTMKSGDGIGVGDMSGSDHAKETSTFGAGLDGEDALRGCKRVVIIGVHGWFPGAVMRTVFGEPTGTSSKFANMMEQALREFELENQVQLEKLTKIPLEGEGTIQRRVERLYSNLLANSEWMRDLYEADAIIVASHSQGSVVSTHLLDRLIADKHIKTFVDPLELSGGDSFPSSVGITCSPDRKSQRVCCLALCGIHLGPLRYLRSSSLVQPYIQYFESAAARELFDFQNTESAVSKAYVQALRNVLYHGVKMVYVASLNDQVVPIYSGTFTAASHPMILRALYIDGDAYHSSDFLSNLLVLLLRLRNSGISDAGLISHLSEATAGSLSGIGHSTAYEEVSTYALAVRYLFEANEGSAPYPELHLEPFDATHEQNDYEIPWSLRDVIADERVIHYFSNEVGQLRDAFREWQPKTTILRDLKRKLQPIQRLPSSFSSTFSTSKL